jgi:Uncharacterized conserved protein
VIIKIGCCGFQKKREIYYENFKLVELQETFYKIPSIDRMMQLRKEAPKDFEFTFKCFQGITHEVSSPTWKRSGIKNLEELKNKVGSLRLTKEVMEYWKEQIKISKALNSKICLIQLPSSFKDNEEGIKNAENFFYGIERNKLEIAIELRGWNRENILKLCKKFNLIHCVDPLKEEATYFGINKIAYFRLHGLGKTMYKYKYTDNDLKNLLNIIKKLELNEVYILFNNIYMYEDALRFQRIVSSNL